MGRWIWRAMYGNGRMIGGVTAMTVRQTCFQERCCGTAVGAALEKRFAWLTGVSTPPRRMRTTLSGSGASPPQDNGLLGFCSPFF